MSPRNRPEIVPVFTAPIPVRSSGQQLISSNSVLELQFLSALLLSWRLCAYAGNSRFNGESSADESSELAVVHHAIDGDARHIVITLGLFRELGKGRDLGAPDFSVLTGAVPKEAASISARDPSFARQFLFLTCNITRSRTVQIASHFRG